MKDILNQLFEGQSLTSEQAKTTLIDIAKGVYNQSQVTAFITNYLIQKITLAELAGFREALLELCIPVDLQAFEPIDLCGTGGDGKNAFNISTISSFVVAGAGTFVAKHGNYGVSSLCGSSNVLEYLGVKFTNDPLLLKKQIETTNLCFLHAPLFHPALKNMAPIRKELGLKTFFNILGPMVNPSKPKHQLVGVFSLDLLRLYANLYQKLGKQYTIVHSLDGFDEISLTSYIKTATPQGEAMFHPMDIGLQQLPLKALSGGNSVRESAQILLSVLNNEGTKAQNDVVLANSAMALKTKNPLLDFSEAMAQARESLQSGKAKEVFVKIVEMDD